MINERQRQEHQRFRQNVVQTVSYNNVVLYGVTYVILLAQLVASVIVLIVSWDQACDTRLHSWLVGYTLRTVLYFPFIAYEQYLGNAVSGPQHRPFRVSKMFFEICALMWFVLGNSYLFGAHTCQDTAPSLYRICLVWVILGYIGLTLPLLFCLLLVFCFPCVYVVISYLAEASSVRQRERVEKEIQSVPTARFHTGMYPEEDAKCIICLEDYQEGVELRVMRCRHHFHKSCADGWFRLKPHCPLCQANLDGTPAEVVGELPRNIPVQWASLEEEDLEAGDHLANPRDGRRSSTNPLLATTDASAR